MFYVLLIHFKFQRKKTIEHFTGILNVYYNIIILLELKM